MWYDTQGIFPPVEKVEKYGEMSEWSKELVSKASDPVRGPWVRIPLSPPFFKSSTLCAQGPNWVPRNGNSRIVSGPDGSSTKGDLPGDVGQPSLDLGQRACFFDSLIHRTVVSVLVGNQEVLSRGRVLNLPCELYRTKKIGRGQGIWLQNRLFHSP